MSTPGRATSNTPDPVAPERQILIAGVGEAWVTGEGSAATVARELAARELPSGVAVHELGTGALDIAYDVMRGYDALVLIDVGSSGAQEGVVEADEEEIDAAIEDGQSLDPRAMDPPTVMQFIKNVGGWPGHVLIVPCDPAGGEAGATEAVDLALATVEELRSA